MGRFSEVAATPSEWDTAALVDRCGVLVVEIGAAASGVGVPGSAADTRGVFAAPGECWWCFEQPPSVLPGPGIERLNWELAEFCRRALRAEPDAMQALGSERVLACTPIGDELRDLRRAFLSQRAADAFRRATAREFARAAAATRTGGTPRHAEVAEVIRLLTIAERLLRTGTLDLDCTGRRDLLTAVRAGEAPWRDVESEVEGLRDQTVRAVLHSPLPIEPDLPAVQRWLLSVRRRSLSPVTPGR